MISPIRRRPAGAVQNSTGVVIGDGWMGAGAKVLDGVEIGPLAVIGAAAVVRENVPASAIAVGIPARCARVDAPVEAIV
jgi:acetyltransferase-like isoleucine patch superfamily enzyme